VTPPTAAEQLDILRSAAGVVDRSDRGFVLVTGPDAISFLQALVSADLDAVADGQGAASLLLTPQGKLDVAFRLLRVGDDAWLDSDPGLGAELAASLNRFRIRVKVDVVDRTGDWGMASVIGPGAGDVAPGPLPPDRHDHVPIGDVEAGDTRLVRTAHGFDVVGPRAAVDTAVSGLVAAGVPTVGADAFEAWRIEQGIPRQPLDIDGATIPQEAFLETDAVSFTKGCFLGQELVCRIDTRGHVNRYLRRLVDVEGDWPEPGAEVVVDGKVVGLVTSVAPPDVPTGALGSVRREVDPPAACELRWSGHTARATVAAV
jgi:folate-binding protein YgfZ